MNVAHCLSQLTANAAAIEQFVESVADAQAPWRPTEDAWSVLEVVNHLLDEECEDFRFRLQHLLSGSSEPWPPIAPQSWVQERDYIHRDFGESLAAFTQERKLSLEWLAEMPGAEWRTAYQHPPTQGLCAGDLLASWVAHDLLHLRQLVELKWAYGRVQCKPFGPDYAGDW
jgi:hypothetical protein